MNGRRQHHDPRTLRRPGSIDEHRSSLGDAPCDPAGLQGLVRTTHSVVESTCAADPLPVANLPELLTFPEVRDLLRVSRNTLYRLSNAGEIPGAYKLGNAWRYPRAALDLWIRGRAPGPARARKAERWG